MKYTATQSSSETTYHGPTSCEQTSEKLLNMKAARVCLSRNLELWNYGIYCGMAHSVFHLKPDGLRPTAKNLLLRSN